MTAHMGLQESQLHKVAEFGGDHARELVCTQVPGDIEENANSARVKSVLCEETAESRTHRNSQSDFSLIQRKGEAAYSAVKRACLSSRHEVALRCATQRTR